MRDVIRRNPGYADMHVAIAADAWGRGDYLEAMKVLDFPNLFESISMLPHVYISALPST